MSHLKTFGRHDPYRAGSDTETGDPSVLWSRQETSQRRSSSIRKRSSSFELGTDCRGHADLLWSSARGDQSCDMMIDRPYCSCWSSRRRALDYSEKVP